MDRIIPYMDQNIIKILVGQRRVGKSYILKSIAQEAMRRNPDANFVTIDLEDFAFSHITSPKILHDEIISRLADNRKNYIFLDEVQEVKGFDKDRSFWIPAMMSILRAAILICSPPKLPLAWLDEAFSFTYIH